MKYTLVIKPSATAEASKVYAYREQEKKGGGDRFLEALSACYLDIKANPYRFSIRKGEYRHVMLHRLKYRVVFRVKGNRINVVQVRHTSQKPSKKFGP